MLASETLLSESSKLVGNECNYACFVFADALRVTVVNATVVNISWANETLHSNDSSDILWQNISAYTVQFR